MFTRTFASRFLSALVCIAFSGTSIRAVDSNLEGIEVTNALLKTIEATVVSAEVSGKVGQLDVVEGAVVRQGQQLGKLRDNAVLLQVEQAKIAMAIARKKNLSDVDLRLAQQKSAVADNELERAESANARIANTYGPKEVDRLRLVASSAKLEIERAKHDRELSELDVMMAENGFRQATELLERHQVTAPVDGIVVSVNRRLGEWVEPGMELLQIVKNDRLRIDGFVASNVANNELVGRSASVIVLIGEEERDVTGQVVFVSPDANPVNGTVRVFLEIDNKEDQFRPGMRVRVVIDPQ